MITPAIATFERRSETVRDEGDWPAALYVSAVTCVLELGMIWRRIAAPTGKDLGEMRTLLADARVSV